MCLYCSIIGKPIIIKRPCRHNQPQKFNGRLDVFTRVITDYAQEFDKIAAGYSGPLYLEISPRTFPIVVRRGSRLSQIRFRMGQPTLSTEALKEEQAKKTYFRRKCEYQHQWCGRVDRPYWQ